jgi:filamentous hemagglutinin family protein
MALLAGLCSLAIGVSASAQEHTVVFDDTPGFGEAGPAHRVAFNGGYDYRIDYCPSCGTEGGPPPLPGGSHGHLVDGGLFQSLLRLDVNEGDAATFAVSEPDITVDSIFARVTGEDPSEIFGLLRSEVESADLYLLNPYGVLFGATAQVDVGGSFYVSTADVLNFENAQPFEAWLGGAVPMEVAAPASFGFLVDEEPPATIRFERTRAADWSVAGDTLSAVAGRIEIEGHGAESDVRALELSGGLIQLAAVPSGTDVPLDVAGLDVASLGSDETSVHLTRNAIVRVSGSGPLEPGRIVIRGGRFEMAQPQGVIRSGLLTASGTGAQEGQLAIDIEVAGTLEVDAGRIESQTTTGARSGDIRLAGRRVELEDDTRVVGEIVGTRNTNDGPDILVEASELAIRDGFGPDSGSQILTRDETVVGTSSGKVGDIRVIAGTIELSGTGSEIFGEGTGIFTLSRGTGDGATVHLEADTSLALSGGSQIVARRLQSRVGGDVPDDLGRIEVMAGTLSLTEPAEFPTEIRSRTSSEIGGAAIRIGTEEAPVANLELIGGSIGSITTASGAGGAVDVHARTIVLESSAARPEVTPQISALTTRAITIDMDGEVTATGGDGRGGNLTVHADSLNLIDGGQVFTGTRGSGPSGNLVVHVEGTLLAEGRNTAAGQEPAPSGIFARSRPFLLRHPERPTEPPTVLPTTGAGGQLDITAKEIVMKAGAEFSAAAQSEGPAGDLHIVAESLLVEGLPGVASSTISAKGASGAGGNLEIQTHVLQVHDLGVVTASTTGSGRSGNVEITAREIEIAGERGTGLFAQSTLGSSTAGRAGSVTLAPPEGERLSLRVRDGAAISVESAATAAGKIQIRGADLVEVSNGGEVSARVWYVTLQPGEEPADLASDIRILDANTLRLSDGTITAETRGNAIGGSVEIEAKNVHLSGGEISTRSIAQEGGDAGDIVIAAAETFEASNSAITTTANDAGGGRISIQGGDLVHLLDSRLETTVATEGLGDAGDIDIPLRGDESDGLDPVVPEFVVVNRSIIHANAVVTYAGDITIDGDHVFVSSDSDIQAEASTPELSGEIRISSPDADVVSQVTPLPSNFVDASDRLLPPCVARTERTGSFVVQSREALPPPPDAPLPPALAGSHDAAGTFPASDSDKCSVPEESS